MEQETHVVSSPLEETVQPVREQVSRFEQVEEVKTHHSARGETMLQILPLARKRLSPLEISKMIGKSHTAVLSSEYKLRKKQRLSPSSWQRNKELVELLTSPPEDQRLCKKLLNQVNYPFYRMHKGLFVNLYECYQLAGLGFIKPQEKPLVLSILNLAGIPFREFHLKVTGKNGKKFGFIHKTIILASGREKAVETLKNAQGFRKSA